MDILSILGFLVGFGAIIGGFLLEHGDLSSFLLPSPLLIVFGGTMGAVMLSFTSKEISSIPNILAGIMKKSVSNAPKLIDQMVEMAETARKEGVLSLEKTVDADTAGKIDPFLKRGILLVIDGTDLQKMEDMLDTEIHIMEQKKKIEASIFEAAGGFSPTMGIIGTVCGLIIALGNMESPEELAKQIAVAFVATLFGVAFANLLYLPIANKVKLQAKNARIEKELIVEGIVAIRNGENPQKVREKLNTFLQFYGKKGKQPIREA